MLSLFGHDRFHAGARGDSIVHIHIYIYLYAVCTGNAKSVKIGLVLPRTKPKQKQKKLLQFKNTFTQRDPKTLGIYCIHFTRYRA